MAPIVVMRLHAVDAYASEVGAQTADREVAAFAGIAGNRHAGDTLQGFGEVQVREFGDLFGRMLSMRSSGIALVIESSFEAAAETGDDHFVD